MRASAIVLSLGLACAAAAAKTTRSATNAERFQRGLPPLAPSRRFAPTRVARSVPSGYTCSQSSNQGVIAVVKEEDVVGYIAYTNIVESSNPPVLSDGGIFQFADADTPNTGIYYVSHSYRNWVIRSDDGDLKQKNSNPLKYGDILYVDKNGILNYAYPGETFDTSDAGSYPKNMHTNTQNPNHSEPAEQNVFYIDSENHNRISVTWVQGQNATNQNPQLLLPFVCNGRLRWSTDPTRSHGQSDCPSPFIDGVELRFICCNPYGGTCY